MKLKCFEFLWYLPYLNLTSKTSQKGDLKEPVSHPDVSEFFRTRFLKRPQTMLGNTFYANLDILISKNFSDKALDHLYIQQIYVTVNIDFLVIIYQCKRTPQLLLASELRLPRVIISQKMMTPRNEQGLPLEYLNLKQMANLKFEALGVGDQRLRQGLINMLQIKVCISS